MHAVLGVGGTLVLLCMPAKLLFTGRAPVILQAKNCDAELWKHVFSPERLRVVEGCTAIEGRVVSVRREADGDLRISLDPEEKSVLNFVNAVRAHGKLVVEVVCDHAPAKDRAKATAACSGFTSQVTAPIPGNRVRITGAYVTDNDTGWNEMHPVTRIEILS